MTGAITRRNVLKSSLLAATAVSLAPATSLAAGKKVMSFQEYRSYDALALAKLVRDRDVSATELLELAIARANAVNPDINCIVEELYDRARREAREGLPKGPFTGVPFLLKDLGMALGGHRYHTGLALLSRLGGGLYQHRGAEIPEGGFADHG